MKLLLFFISYVLINNIAITQNTIIPDSNFESALISLGYDTGFPDGIIPTANIDTINYLNISNKNINDLTGIEDFIVLTSLNCAFNLLSILNVTQNSLLTVLSCNDNFITTLDVSQNTGLTGFDCSLNQLSNLDVSQQVDLLTLFCYGNQLNSLDVTKNTTLIRLDCQINQLNILDVRNGNNSNVILFDAGSNPNLDCIYVDDKNASYLTLPVWNKDASTYWATDSLDCQTIISVDEYSLGQEVLLYPNPNNGTFTIDAKDFKLTTIEIYNLSGQLILEKTLVQNDTKVDLTKFSKGIYFVKVNTVNGVLLEKIIYN